MGHTAAPFPYRSALITGASGGLGRAFARALRSAGVAVWGTSRQPSAQVPAEGLRWCELDLDGAGAVDRVAALVAEVDAAAPGGLDLVVHNAGYGVYGEFALGPAEVWRRQVAALLDVSLALDHAAMSVFRRRGRGALVNVTSLAVEFPIPFMAGYNTAKSGLAALTASLELEADNSEIIVLDFRPGDYATGFNRAMIKPATFAPDSPRLARVWATLERHLAAAPPPERAARDLLRALRRGRRGVVRSGSFFQACLAPALARIAPAGWRRAVVRRYFGAL
jgi:NAD(P)-dependent dehydrogenase (short-subunit alcohol dehydrogenase family)